MGGRREGGEGEEWKAEEENVRHIGDREGYDPNSGVGTGFLICTCMCLHRCVPFSSSLPFQPRTPLLILWKHVAKQWFTRVCERTPKGSSLDKAANNAKSACVVSACPKWTMTEKAIQKRKGGPRERSHR